MTKAPQASSKRKKLIVWLGVVCAALAAAGTFLCLGFTSKEPGAGVLGVTQTQANTDGWMSSLTMISGRSRPVSPEEYDFFYKMVRQDSPSRNDEITLEAETKDFINHQNAMFYIAELAGLAEPYSFEAMQENMEQENQHRKEMKENGEVFYGLERFELNSYYQYITSNLQLDIFDYLVAQSTDEIIKEAKDFFTENIEDYQTIESVTYQQ